MKPLIYLTCVLCSLACGSPRSSTGDRLPSKNQYARLLRAVVKNPNDQALGQQLQTAYALREQEQLAAIAQLASTGTPQGLDRLLSAYKSLQSFYNEARANATIENLLNPGSVERQIADTRLLAADAWYTQAQIWLDEQYWQTARQALSALEKVERWYPNYKSAANLMRQARELSVIDVVLLPLRNEGFFGAGIFGNGFGNGLAQRLSGQFANDLGGRFSNSGRLRAWDSYELRGGFQNPNPDVLVEPVCTNWQRQRENRQQYNRTTTKQVESGRDSLNRPLYKTITATLHIVELTEQTSANFELRLTDVARQNRMGQRQWAETYTLQQQWATFSGDANALGPADWDLLRSPQSNMRPTDEWIQQQILERIYPDMLQYLRGQLN